MIWKLLPAVRNPVEVSLVKDGGGDIKLGAILGDQEDRPTQGLVLALYNIYEAES